MEILTFIFLMLNVILMVCNGLLLYRINYYSLENRQLVYSNYGDFWNKGDLEENDIYS